MEDNRCEKVVLREGDSHETLGSESGKKKRQILCLYEMATLHMHINTAYMCMPGR